MPQCDSRVGQHLHACIGAVAILQLSTAFNLGCLSAGTAAVLPELGVGTGYKLKQSLHWWAVSTVC